MQTSSIGLVGLAVMGENLALNIEEKGFPISVYNRSTDKVDDFVARHPGKKISGQKSPEAFVRSIERPRRIIMMVKAGKPVDDTIASLVPFLEQGDMLVDGGNEFFTETERRVQELQSKGIRYVGMGVSGGEEGARHGPSMMPGGERAAYDALAPVLTKVSAQVDDGPCVDYMGPGGAGHYVKMVHNGIEYGDMQLIAEAYDVLATVGGFGHAELAETFFGYNKGELQSFLIEITAKIFTKKDDQGTGKMLVDQILDAAGMKGTGKWTVQEAAELGSPVPTIASSVEARALSSRQKERAELSRMLGGPTPKPLPGVDKSKLKEEVRHALYASKICSYAQGMSLLRAASEARSWGLDLGRIARIWKGGCIIRAQFLDRIKTAYGKNPSLANLFFDSDFGKELSERQTGWRRVVTLGVEHGLAMPTMMASLSYYDSYRRARCPANLIQAQRDFFGAHTFQRIDREGAFHAKWGEV